LHVLLNYEWDSRALLSLILVGLPELQDRLELRKNRSLYSRIHRRLSVGPLTTEDTAEYVRMRLRRVGCDRELFAAGALVTLHDAASSSLREIDRLATAAMREAARRKSGSSSAMSWPAWSVTSRPTSPDHTSVVSLPSASGPSPR
jgi:type II secretory pathway predicted ATPase ExeA